VLVVATAVQFVAKSNTALLRDNASKAAEHEFTAIAGGYATLLLKVFTLLGNSNAPSRLRLISGSIGEVGLEDRVTFNRLVNDLPQAFWRKRLKFRSESDPTNEHGVADIAGVTLIGWLLR
jgi:hypothetical protein